MEPESTGPRADACTPKSKHDGVTHFYSTNSSEPPSSEGLAGEQRARGRKHRSKRKPGGQPGHAGHHRPLVLLTQVTAVEVVLPKHCGTLR